MCVCVRARAITVCVHACACSIPCARLCVRSVVRCVSVFVNATVCSVFASISHACIQHMSMQSIGTAHLSLIAEKSL